MIDSLASCVVAKILKGESEEDGVAEPGPLSALEQPVPEADGQRLPCVDSAGWVRAGASTPGAPQAGDQPILSAVMIRVACTTLLKAG